MPTGYTCKIEEGQTFKEFALGCAKAFGANLELRDKPSNTKIPDKYKIDSYYLDELNKSKKELNDFNKLSIKDLEIKTKKYNKNNIDSYKKQVKKMNNIKEKYELMLKKVKDYEPPTEEHINFKEFMIEQIIDSIKFDCYEIPKVKEITVDEYKKMYLKDINYDITYYKEQYQKEIERTNNNNKWNEELRNSLK